MTTRHSVRAGTRDRTEARDTRDQGNVPSSLVTFRCLELMQITPYKGVICGLLFLPSSLLIVLRTRPIGSSSRNTY